MTRFELHHGDCLEVMRGMEAGSVHCCVTSPPYYGLRDYGVEGQLGLEETPDAYVSKMVDVFREVRRILRDDGTCWLNLGDSYAANRSYQVEQTKGGLKHGMAQSVKGRGQTAAEYGLKPKDLIGIPWRVAFALQADGWWLRSEIIWHKPNPMPESVTDRPTKSHEQIFLLTKSAKYFYDAESVREKHSRDWTNSGGSMYHPEKFPNGSAQHRGGKKPPQLNPSGRNKRSVWSIATKPLSGAHFAVFPPKLIEPCILAGCPDKVCPHCGAGWERVVEKVKTFESGSGKSGNPTSGKQDLAAKETNSTPDIRKGPCITSTTTGFKPTCECRALVHIPGTVFDPFTGSGTTGLVSLQHGRRFVGIELNPEYHAMAEGRLSAVGKPKPKTTTIQGRKAVQVTYAI